MSVSLAREDIYNMLNISAQEENFSHLIVYTLERAIKKYPGHRRDDRDTDKTSKRIYRVSNELVSFIFMGKERKNI